MTSATVPLHPRTCRRPVRCAQREAGRGSFLILDGTTTGAFHTLDLPALPAGRFWQLQTGSVTLPVVEAPADDGAAGVSRFLIQGLERLRNQIANWMQSFNLPDFDFACIAVHGEYAHGGNRDLRPLLSPVS